MTELQTALISAGVGVVVLVYLYNWWQHVRRRREIERAVAAHSGRGQTTATDPLDALAALAPDAAAGHSPGRIEPSLAQAPSGSDPDDNPGDAGRARLIERARRLQAEQAAADDALPDAAIPAGGMAADGFGFDAVAAPVPSAAATAARLEPVWQPPAQGTAPPVPRRDGPPTVTNATLPGAAAPAANAAVPSRPRSAPPRPLAVGLALRPDPPGLDPRVDYLIRLLPLEPVTAELLSGQLASTPELGRRVVVLGCPVGGQDWQAPLQPSARYEELAFALQQIDRSGLVERGSLERFVAWVEDVAERLSAGISPPEVAEAHSAAASFDAFCAEVDVLIGINVVAPDVPVPGTRVRALVESAGFRLQPQGHYQLEDERGHALLSLTDIDGEPLVADRMRTAAINGITLLLDIPRTREPSRVFAQMVQIARQVAQGMGGRLVDDQRQPLTDPGVRAIAARIVAIENRLLAEMVPPGSPLARRVFE